VPGGKFEISEKIKDPTGSMECYKFKEKKRNYGKVGKRKIKS